VKISSKVATETNTYVEMHICLGILIQAYL